MNNGELSYKLKYILHELGMNKTEFLEECRKFSSSMSKPTILNAINGKNTIAPTIETLSVIIKVCQTSGNEKLKHISYDFLLNETIKDVEAKNSTVYQSIGLTDEVINRLKQYNHPLYYDYGSIINYYFIHIPVKYWSYIEMLKITSDIQKSIKVIKSYKDLKDILKIFDNDAYLEYIERNFKNIYTIYKDLKNQGDLTREVNEYLNELDNLMVILNNHFRYLILELDNKFFDNMLI